MQPAVGSTALYRMVGLRFSYAFGARRSPVQDLLEAVGLWEHRSKRPAELRGGRRQRVAIARALAKHPYVIIADEPTASLDQATGKSVMEVFQRFCRERGVTIVASSHEPMVQLGLLTAVTATLLAGARVARMPIAEALRAVRAN